MKYTFNEFAQEIRKMYAGDYDDLSDHNLVELWLKKYPSDKDKVELIQEKNSNQQYVPISNKKNSKTLIGFLIMLVFFTLLIFTNPDESKHIAEFQIVLKKTINEQAETSNGGTEDNDFFKTLGLLFVNGMIDEISSKYVTRENFILFSTTKIQIENQTETIGIGIFGNVFISNRISDEIKKALKK